MTLRCSRHRPCAPSHAHPLPSCASSPPQQLYDLSFDYRYMMRGLVIDKRRGNMIKVDRHK